jgi:hypothetical protein
MAEHTFVRMASWSNHTPETQTQPADLACLECRGSLHRRRLRVPRYPEFAGQIGIYCPTSAEREFGDESRPFAS